MCVTGSSRKKDTPQDSMQVVWLNVYDMSPHNKFVYPLGLGIYHSGVEVYGTELAYGGHENDSSGIFQMRPRVGVPGIKLRSSIRMGETSLSRSGLAEVLRRMGSDYTGRAYNILSRNCNHFAKDLSYELCGAKVPGWINRLAYLGTMLPCAVQTADADWMPAAPDLGNKVQTLSESGKQSSNTRSN